MRQGGHALAASDPEDCHTSVLEGDGAVSDDDSYQCFLCHETDLMCNLPEAHAGHLFHTKCWNANRAYLRTIQKSSAATLKHKHNLVHDGEAWRGSVMPFLKSDPVSRSQARQHVRAELLEFKEPAHVEAT